MPIVYVFIGLYYKHNLHMYYVKYHEQFLPKSLPIYLQDHMSVDV
jgi:hypothetical protein